MPQRSAAGKLAKVAVDRAVRGFANGLALVLDGSTTPVGNTPRDRVLHRGKLEVFRYRGRAPEEVPLGKEAFVLEERRFPIPVLLVPPLMVRPYIYDLRPEHSMVRALLKAGYDVFAVDFGVPDDTDVGVKLDDYVLDWLPASVAAVREASGRRELTLAGYCMGGIFSLLYTAAHRDDGVRNLVSIASPVDFAKMGLLTYVARLGHRYADRVVDRIGNIPGRLNSEALKMLAPVKRLTRYADLFINLWNDEYVRGFDAMSQWANDFIPYPQAAFKQFLRDFMVDNALKDGLRFGDRVADLAEIRAGVLVFAGVDDTIATPGSVRALRRMVKNAPVDYREVPGGHIGVIAGGRAPAAVWKPTAEWLRTRSL